MADNTLLPSGDVIRDIQRGGSSGPKTQVFILDMGGGDAGSENLMMAGQQLMAGSIPVVLPSNQSSIPVNTFAQILRNGGILHRNQIAVPDKLATPALGAISAVTESGSVLTNTSYTITVAAFNRWGATLPSSTQSLTPSASQAIRIPITQVPGADGYDIFLSTAANPLWVGFLTEAQRAAGGTIISAVGQATTGGSAPAGNVDVGAVGTGVASNAAPFTFNNAYTPAAGTITPINCAGYNVATVHVKMVLADRRSLPTLSVIPFYQDQLSTGDWLAGSLQSVSLLSANGQPLEQQFTFNVNGATNLAILVDTITGQGANVFIWVELSH